MIAGLVGLGFALEEGYHYMLTSLFWGLYVFGIMISTVALVAYNLDSYPEASGEVSALINFARSKCNPISDYSLKFRGLISLSDRRVHYQLFPSHLGTVDWHESQLWHSSGNLCCRILDHRCTADVWEEIEGEEWRVEFFDGLGWDAIAGEVVFRHMIE